MSVWRHGGMLDAGETISPVTLSFILNGHFRPIAAIDL